MKRVPRASRPPCCVRTRNGRPWVKCWFYWLRDARGADTLAENIDGGIYKECSISFTFLFPECSVCGRDIRTCPHQPFEKYTARDTETTCHYYYRNIERVLETSLVYRGAVPDTALTNELLSPENLSRPPRCEIPIDSPTELPAAARYLIMPHYEGIPVTVESNNGQLSFRRVDGRPLHADLSDRFATESLPPFQSACGFIIGLRGKQRFPTDTVEAFLRGDPTSVSRLELRLLPQAGLSHANAVEKGRFTIRIMPHLWSDLAAVEARSRKLSTASGVLIWPENTVFTTHGGYRYRPAADGSPPDDSYTLSRAEPTGTACLTFTHHGQSSRFVIRQFNFARLVHGGKFFADPLDESETDPPPAVHKASGRITSIRRHFGGFRLQLTGKLTGDLLIRPVKIDGIDRFLVYRV